MRCRRTGPRPASCPPPSLRRGGAPHAGRRKKGLRVLRAAWREAPHPNLAAALAEIWADEDAIRRYALVRDLDAGNPGDPEGHLALARAALDAGRFDQARGHLEALGAGSPDTRTCRLWAELEDAQNGPGLAAREWLMRAANAREDPSWVCGSCGKAAVEWHVTCPRCRDFDSIDWRAVSVSAAPPRADVGAVADATVPAPLRSGSADDADDDMERRLTPPVSGLPSSGAVAGGSPLR